MPTLELTARGIEALPIPPDEERLADYNDSRESGLCLRVFSSGRRSWYVRYRANGKRRRYKLGDYPALGLSDARKRAARLKVDVRDGEDPLHQRQERRDAETVGDLIEWYLSEYAVKHLASKTLVERERILRGKDVSYLLGMIANEVEPADVALALDRIERRNSHIMLNRTQVALSAVFKWAAIRRRAGVVQNPVKVLPRRFSEKARERVLDADEVRTVWRDVSGRSVGAPTALKLILTTAQRPGEIGAMRWAHIEGAVWRMPKGHRKRPRGEDASPPHDVPLSALTLDLLAEIRVHNSKEQRDGYRLLVFPSESEAGHLLYNGISQAAQRIVKRKKMERWTPHDLRRTAATHMTGLGHGRLIVEKILGHKDPTVAGIYDRHAYWDERTEALDAWADRLQEIVG